VFVETHQDPDHAPCDGPSMIALKELPPLLERLMQLDAIAKRAEMPTVDADIASAMPDKVAGN